MSAGRKYEIGLSSKSNFSSTAFFREHLFYFIVYHFIASTTTTATTTTTTPQPTTTGIKTTTEEPTTTTRKVFVPAKEVPLPPIFEKPLVADDGEAVSMLEALGRYRPVIDKAVVW